MNIKKLLLCAAGFVALSTAAANASSYSVSVFEGQGAGTAQATSGFAGSACGVNGITPAFSGFACATFTYTGPLNFSNTTAQNTLPTGDLNSTFFAPGVISSYLGAGTVTSGGSPAPYSSQTVADFTTMAKFMASSGSVAGNYYSSYYTIDLGTLAAGTILTITHDDGIALSNNGTAFGSTNPGATTAVTDAVAVTSSGDVKLYYTRQNGTPSILQVAVPEPASLSIFGAALLGLAGMAGLKRRNRKSV